MRTETPDQLYLDRTSALTLRPSARPERARRTPECVSCWALANRITDEDDLGWINLNRLEDVVIWLHGQGCRPLAPTLRTELNNGLALPLPTDPEEPDVRVCIPRVIQIIEKATLLHLNDRLRQLIEMGVIDADILLSGDAGRGPAIKLLHRLDHARDTDSNRGGGLRRAMTATDGIQPHEAQLVARLLLGTSKRDQAAIPIRHSGLSTRIGASSALVCGVLRVPRVSVDTALAWAHAAERAMNPSISPTDMRRQVTNPIKRMAAALSTGPTVIPTALQLTATRVIR
jgi:hypothetical protein